MSLLLLFANPRTPVNATLAQQIGAITAAATGAVIVSGELKKAKLPRVPPPWQIVNPAQLPAEPRAS
jgi:hypothetical protein